MKATVLYGPRDVRYEQQPDPTITKPTDAILRLSATCICGSDLWPYRGRGEPNGLYGISSVFRAHRRLPANRFTFV